MTNLAQQKLPQLPQLPKTPQSPKAPQLPKAPQSPQSPHSSPNMPDPVRIKRALLSVSNKTGLIELAQTLQAAAVTLYASSGTAKALQAAAIPVQTVESLSASAELFNGRVKTLHPKIHGGILMNPADPEHRRQAAAAGIEPFELVVINLYPFARVSDDSQNTVTLATALEFIDIGGPALLRAAAKNFFNVTVVSDPNDYAELCTAISSNGSSTSRALRSRLAVKAFEHTAQYDKVIHERLAQKLSTGHFTAPSPAATSAQLSKTLRYGENPHQTATLEMAAADEREPFAVAAAQQLSGAELSYNNLLDASAAVAIVREVALSLDQHVAAVIKHGTPCGLAAAPAALPALQAALAGDTVSRYGSVIALSTPLTEPLAAALKNIFIELLIAPAYSADARKLLAQKNKRLRILALPGLLAPARFPAPNERRELISATLKQTPDHELAASWTSATSATTTPPPQTLLQFATIAVKQLKSNAIAIAAPLPSTLNNAAATNTSVMLLGQGCGQPNRLDAVVKLALPKFEENMALLPADVAAVTRAQAVLASDAFFPFPDSLQPIHKSGIRTVLQPGGSMRDEAVLKEATRLNMNMILTQRRHFKH